MFGCKAPAVCNGWQWLISYNEKTSTSKYAWLNEQHELLTSANKHALKHIKQSAQKDQARASGKALETLLDNLVLRQSRKSEQNSRQS